ncbi:hypothetical protein P7L91_03440 [Bisgaard Taxon 10/6]|uniref:hypothetical protein n=1 Tax=Exercitatus varius TaxID=67857 RepID=UPI00294AC178|nr:hypothetical protein [Exercitatus varius]MDG2959896.1 hypothetical protein [Exercitatus varius]
MTVKFDNDGFAVESGFIQVYVIDEQGIFSHAEEQFISAGCGLSANSVLTEPKPAKQGFAVQYVAGKWQYVEDHRGETVYSTTDKTALTITELGEIPENYTALAPICENCEWNGEGWQVSAEKQAELKAKKLQQFITAIDNKAASIYSIWTRFESEYRERKDAALAFQAANYQGEVSRYITDFAQKANLDNKTATDIIFQQATGLEKLQVELANQRMRKYELKRDGLSLEAMQAIHDDIIQQMNNLAEAYQNG